MPPLVWRLSFCSGFGLVSGVPYTLTLILFSERNRFEAVSDLRCFRSARFISASIIFKQTAILRTKRALLSVRLLVT